MYPAPLLIFADGESMACMDTLELTGTSFEFTTSACVSSDISSALARHLPTGSTLLELGSGCGSDLPWLANRYRVTASDICEDVIASYQNNNPYTPILRLDALTIELVDQFDCIFSNKVMQHLSDEEMCRSMQRQAQVVRPGGVVAHTFWVNTSIRQAQAPHTNHSHAQLIRVVSMHFEIMEVAQYSSSTPFDSLLVITRNSLFQ